MGIQTRNMWYHRGMMRKVMLPGVLVLALAGCALEQGPGIEPEDIGAEAEGATPPPPNGCGWPYVGSLVVPALPAGAACYYVGVPAGDVHTSAVLMRSDPTWCGHGDRNTVGAACSMRGCVAIGSVRPGQVVDVWSLRPVGAALASVAFEAHPSGECSP